MESSEIEKLVLEYLRQATQGLSKEHPKFDFKRKWYALTTPKGISEFLKDTSAIANTPGEDGFIAIGFDDKTKEFHPAKFSDSGLLDPSDLNGIIAKRVEPVFEITCFDMMYKEHTVSVLHMPESINKPHVIKQFLCFAKGNEEGRPEDHRIFIRKNTSVNRASRHDLDRMYRERYGGTEPDIDLRLSVQSTSTSLQLNEEDDRLFLTCNVYLENYGRKTAFIKEILMDILVPAQSTNQIEIFTMCHSPKPSSIRVDKKNQLIAVFYSVSEKYFQNEIERQRFQKSYNEIARNITYRPAKIRLSDGKIIEAEVETF
jgi:hypothetical protein